MAQNGKGIEMQPFLPGGMYPSVNLDETDLNDLFEQEKVDLALELFLSYFSGIPSYWLFQQERCPSFIPNSDQGVLSMAERAPRRWGLMSSFLCFCRRPRNLMPRLL